MLVVNAANIDKDFAWLKRHCPPGVEMTNHSDETALIAVQGPTSWSNWCLSSQDIASIAS